jgi:2-C-methyl-D-erythritol 4-phosphate cytidylyltransferase
MTVAIVPLKATSERLPGKNFRNLAGKPLYRWSLEKLLQLNHDKIISAVHIYCDSYTWKILDRDITTNATWIQETEPNSYPEGNGFFNDMSHSITYSNIMFVNATAPFVRLETYVKCCRAIEPPYDSAVTVKPLVEPLTMTPPPAPGHKHKSHAGLNPRPRG